MLIPSRKWQKAGVSNYKLCLRNSVSNTSLRIFWNQVFQYEEEWLGCVMNGSACERLMTVIGSNSILCNTTKDSIHKTQYAWCMSINLWMVLKYGSLFLSQESFLLRYYCKNIWLCAINLKRHYIICWISVLHKGLHFMHTKSLN